jgi:hypothetical protein
MLFFFLKSLGFYEGCSCKHPSNSPYTNLQFDRPNRPDSLLQHRGRCPNSWLAYSEVLIKLILQQNTMSAVALAEEEANKNLPVRTITAAEEFF